ncbi:MAG: tripartite tricarboxylate transporter substrate binding protein [Burkholderiales bacterium]
MEGLARHNYTQEKIAMLPGLRQCLWSLVFWGFASLTWAQTWPAKPIRILVGYAPGGVTDIIARTVALPLGDVFGQSVVVENRPGAAGLIATEFVAKSPPDGYTLLMFVDGNSMMPAALKGLKHDPVKSFAQVTILGRGALVLVAHPSFPPNTLQEMIQYAKRNPAQMAFATPGKSGPQHLAFESLKTLGGFQAEHIPYKGGGQAIVDVVAGQVKIGMLGMAPSLPHIKAGKLKAIVVTGAQRAALLPDVPTVAESGFPGYQVAQWQGLVAPAGTPPAVIARLHDELVKIMSMPAVAEKLASIGMDNSTSATPAEFTQWVQHETDRWPALFKAAGIAAE